MSVWKRGFKTREAVATRKSKRIAKAWQGRRFDIQLRRPREPFHRVLLSSFNVARGWQLDATRRSRTMFGEGSDRSKRPPVPVIQGDRRPTERNFYAARTFHAFVHACTRVHFTLLYFRALPTRRPLDPHYQGANRLKRDLPFEYDLSYDATRLESKMIGNFYPKTLWKEPQIPTPCWERIYTQRDSPASEKL